MSGDAPHADAGTQFFYAPPRLQGSSLWWQNCPLTFEGLQALRVGQHIKCVFSNYSPESGAAALREWLLQEQGFESVRVKRALSAHIISRRQYSSLKATYALLEGGGLELTKLQSGQAKPFFLSMCYNDDRADMRLRVAAVRTLVKGGGSLAHSRHSIALEAARACRLEGGMLVMPQHFAANFELDGVREKEKEIFEGYVKVGNYYLAAAPAGRCHSGGSGSGRKGDPVRLRLVIQHVHDRFRGKSVIEVYGSCPDLACKQGNRAAGQGSGGGSGGAGASAAAGAAGSAEDLGGAAESGGREAPSQEWKAASEGGEAASGGGEDASEGGEAASEGGAEDRPVQQAEQGGRAPAEEQRARREECLLAMVAFAKRARMFL